MSPGKPPKKFSKPRATSLKEVAEAANVHVTTVSRALRNSPQIPEATRRHLQKLAKDMGYVANPMIVALMEQRRTGRRSDFRGTLAFITHSFAHSTAESNAHTARIYRAATAQAALMGYKLDHFESQDYANNGKRMERALHARNIRGLFFAPPIFPEPGLPDGRIVELNWEHFAVITISNSNVRPAMDQVDGDFFMGARLAFQTCVERGYRSPAFIALKSHDIRYQGRWRGGFLSASQESTVCRHIPVLMEDDEHLADAFEPWFRKWRPDVLITNHLVLQICLPVMEKMSVKIPRDVALVQTNLHEWDIPQSGIHVGLEISSRQAVETLVGKIHKNALGLPAYPHIFITPPAWKEGFTLPHIDSPEKQRVVGPLPVRI